MRVFWRVTFTNWSQQRQRWPRPFGRLEAFQTINEQVKLDNKTDGQELRVGERFMVRNDFYMFGCRLWKKNLINLKGTIKLKVTRKYNFSSETETQYSFVERITSSFLYAREFSVVARCQVKQVLILNACWWLMFHWHALQRRRFVSSRNQRGKRIFLYSPSYICAIRIVLFLVHTRTLSQYVKYQKDTCFSERTHCSKDSTRKRQSFTRSSVFLETLLRVLRKIRDFLGRQVDCWCLALHKFPPIEPIFPLLLGKFNHLVERGFNLSTKWRGRFNVWSFLLKTRVEID